MDKIFNSLSGAVLRELYQFLYCGRQMPSRIAIQQLGTILRKKPGSIARYEIRPAFRTLLKTRRISIEQTPGTTVPRVYCGNTLLCDGAPAFTA